jgi:hypothetical protein
MSQFYSINYLCILKLGSKSVIALIASDYAESPVLLLSDKISPIFPAVSRSIGHS